MLPLPIWSAPALAAGLLLAPAPPPATQDAGSPDAAPGTLLIRAEKIVVRPGQVLENAAILVVGDRITQVGTDLQAPDGAQVIEGAVVCAGFIDPWSSLGITPLGARDERTDASTLSLDAFDPWRDFERSRALQAGVVATRIQAGEEGDIAGLGAVVSTAPGTDLDALTILGDSNLAATIGATDRGRAADVFDRIGQVDKLAGELHDGLDYAEEVAKYERELAEWEAAIAKKEAELEKDFKKAKKDREKAIEKAEEDGKEHKEEKYKEDKKPSPPRYDAEKEVLARVANGEVPLVVHAHRAAELRELLATTREYKRLRMIVAGATEALVVADELAARHIPVLLWPVPLGTQRPDEWDGHDLGLAGRLAEKGVTVLLGSGGTDDAHDLPLLARLAIGHGLDREDAFAALTYEAARAFDVADQLGSVARGRRADLLILDGDPLGPNTTVRQVLVAGRVVSTGAGQ